jgi:hypothetical protein
MPNLHLRASIDEADRRWRPQKCKFGTNSNLIIVFLFTQAKEFGDFVLLRIRGVNQRTMDGFTAKAIYFIAIAYEKLGLLT